MIIKSYDLNHIVQNKYSTFLLYGENEGLKEDITKKIFIKNFKGEILKLDEKEVLENYDKTLEELQNKSLFNDEKLIIIFRVTNKILDFIKEFVIKKIENVKLVLNAGLLEKNSKLRSFFEKEKNTVCTPFYEDNQQTLSIYANNFLKEKKIKISQEAINIVIERAGGDRINLNNELKKIESLSLSKKNISTEDILKLTNLSGNYNIFELVDNYLAKNKKKVSKIINENNFVNEDSIVILRTLLSRSKRLLKLKSMQNINRSIDDTISIYKPPIFWKEKDLVKKQMSNWSEEEVKKKIFEISNLEILIKRNTSSINLVSDLISNY